MDLCDREYGFLHLPSLLVFLNPWSEDPAVSDFIVNQLWHPKAPKKAAMLPPESFADLLHRVGSLVHERKHFHDLLLTPFGNRLVRLSFQYALSVYALFQSREWRPGQTIAVPAGAEAFPQEEALRRVLAKRDEFLRAFESGRMLLEATAVLAQREFAWTVFGEHAHTIVCAQLASHPVYSSLLRALEVVGSRIGAPTRGFARIAHMLLLAYLGRGVQPDGSSSHTGAFIAVLERLSALHPGSFGQVEQATQAAWVIAEGNMGIEEEENAKFLDLLRDKAHRWAPPPLAENLRATWADFSAKARVMHELFRRQRDTYLNLDLYVQGEGEWVEPLTYLYCVRDDLCLGTEPLDLKREELVAHVEYEDPVTKAKRYSYRVMPAAVPLSGPCMDRSLWVTFARSLGGVVTLLEPLDWLHPLQAHWLRLTERLTGVRFVRRSLTAGHGSADHAHS